MIILIILFLHLLLSTQFPTKLHSIIYKGDDHGRKKPFLEVMKVECAALAFSAIVHSCLGVVKFSLLPWLDKR